MPDTRTIRLNQIAEDYCYSLGIYTAGNSIRAVTEERDALLVALRHLYDSLVEQDEEGLIGHAPQMEAASAILDRCAR